MKKYINKVFTSPFVILIFFLSFNCLAKKKPKKVIVSFEEDLVEGSLTGADLFLILQKDQEQFKRLFKLRKNFLKELKRDSYSIK